LSVDVQEGHIVVRVADDGCGLPAVEQMDPGHLGLVGMRERAALLSGVLELTSAPGKGTTVTLRIPMTSN
jgi:signal transduction histidine kinase